MKIIDSEFLKNKIFENQRIVFIIGAGVSVNAGIPDFRSAQGLFANLKRLGVKGTDLFTYKESITMPTREIYLEVIKKMRKYMETAQPTLTHNLMKNWKTRKFRVYTQNIDCLEEKSGLKCTKNTSTELVYLHGNLKQTSCIFCGFKMTFTSNFFDNGEVTCPRCLEENVKREKNNRRILRPGFMHPNIVHYHQNHPDPGFISKMTNADRDCTLLVVIGTSLKIHGVKMLVKFFSQVCKQNNGYSIYVNLEEPTKEFAQIFDFMWKGDSDTFSEAILRIHGKNKVIENFIEKYKTKINNNKEVDVKIEQANKDLNDKKDYCIQMKTSNKTELIATDIKETCKVINPENFINSGKKENKVLKMLKPIIIDAIDGCLNPPSYKSPLKHETSTKSSRKIFVGINLKKEGRKISGKLETVTIQEKPIKEENMIPKDSKKEINEKMKISDESADIKNVIKNEIKKNSLPIREKITSSEKNKESSKIKTPRKAATIADIKNFIQNISEKILSPNKTSSKPEIIEEREMKLNKKNSIKRKGKGLKNFADVVEGQNSQK